MPRLYVARYDPGPDYAHNPFVRPGIDPARYELLAIDGDDRLAIVLFEADESTARMLASAGCEVTRAAPGRYRDQGSEAVIVVRADGTFVVEENC